MLRVWFTELVGKLCAEKLIPYPSAMRYRHTWTQIKGGENERHSGAELTASLCGWKGGALTGVAFCFGSTTTYRWKLLVPGAHYQLVLSVMFSKWLYIYMFYAFVCMYVRNDCMLGTRDWWKWEGARRRRREQGKDPRSFTSPGWKLLNLCPHESERESERFPHGNSKHDWAVNRI